MSKLELKQENKKCLFDDQIVDLADVVRRQSKAHCNYRTIDMLADIIRRYVPDSMERDWALEILEGD
jgi:hypothetical protein